MPEWHSILQENATPSAASASASPELPGVGSIVARPGNWRGKACRFPSHMRLFLSILASVTAVAFLVFFCSRAYERRAFQDPRSRRLASSEDSDVPVDVCGSSSEEEPQQEHQNPQRPSVPTGEDWQLPLKKRLLSRAAGDEAGGDGRSPQQQEQQQQHDEAVPAAHGLFPPTAVYIGAAPFGFRSPLSGAPVRTPAELDAASGLLKLLPYRRDAGSFAPGAREASAPLEVRQLRREVRLLQRQLERERRQYQELQLLLQQQRGQEGSNYQQHHMQWQHMQWQHLHWQQQQQQQAFLHHQVPPEYHPQQHLPQLQEHQGFLYQQQQQYFLQEQGHYPFLYQQQQHHVLQEQVNQPQPHQFLPQLQEQQQSLYQQHQQHLLQEKEHEPFLHQPQQQHLHQEHVEQHLTEQPEQQQQQQQQLMLLLLQDHQHRQDYPQQPESQKPHVSPQGESKQQHEPDDPSSGRQSPMPAEEGQHQLSQADDNISGDLQEDEWIDVESPASEAAQSSSPQQVLESYSPAAAPSHWLPYHSSIEAVHGSPQAAPGIVATAGAAGALGDETAAGPAPGGAAAIPAVAIGQYTAETVSVTSTTAGGGANSVPVLTSLLSSGSREGTRATGTGAATTAAGGTASRSTASDSEIGKLLELSRRRSDGDLTHHPFVRLPKRGADFPLFPFLVDMRSAMSGRPSKRDPVPLLHRAHDLLLLRQLHAINMRELVDVTEDLIAHAIRYQHFDLWQHSTLRAAERLAVRYLVLDAVVSAFTVLDQTPDPELWETFTNTISHTFPVATPWGRNPPQTQVYADRARQLSKAIQILKGGKRLRPTETVMIKRMIFCTEFSPAFRKPVFDRWRADERDFSGNN